MAAVTFSGLASGLDTQALIQAILDAERAPLQRLQIRQTVFNQQRSAFDELRSRLKAFESSLRTRRGRSCWSGHTRSPDR